MVRERLQAFEERGQWHRVVRRQEVPSGIQTPTADPTTTTAATPTTTPRDDTTSRASATPTTTPPADTTTPPASTTPATTTPRDGTTTPPSSSSAPPPSSSSSARQDESTVVSVITPTTVIVVGTSYITSQLPPTTISSVTPTSSAGSGADNAGSSNKLSSGAKAGIIAGSVVGGIAVLALLILGCLGLRRRRSRKLEAKENIKWPEIAASAEDRAALYPEQTHPTGKAGFGVGDDMEEVGGASGAGLAGAGAGAWAAGNLHRQPTLPTLPPSVYSDGAYDPSYPSSHDPSYPSSHDASYPPSHDPSYGSNGYTPYSPPQSSYGGAGYSNQSHGAMLPAGAGAGVPLRTTPSPPRSYGGAQSSQGHGYDGGFAPGIGGAQSSQGHGYDGGFASGVASDPGHDIDDLQTRRSASPTPQQVGSFGGYDEGNANFRLSVVNHDN